MKRELMVLALLLSATTAHADWLYEGSEGSSYAYTTDCGFVDGSYQIGLMFFCPDDWNPCEFRVAIQGQTPRPPVVDSFTFSDGQTVERLSESVGGGKPQVGWDEILVDKLMSDSSVVMTVPHATAHR